MIILKEKEKKNTFLYNISLSLHGLSCTDERV